jgi:hypothetical protein
MTIKELAAVQISALPEDQVREVLDPISGAE